MTLLGLPAALEAVGHVVVMLLQTLSEYIVLLLQANLLVLEARGG